MNLAGFNFTKINAEKMGSFVKDTKINTSINIESIEEAKNFPKMKDSFLLIKWKYSLQYSPNVSKFDFEGNMVISIEEKKCKEILKEWKNKKLNVEFNTMLINLIIKKANIKAINLEDEFGLPIHFKMPSVKLENKK